MNVIFSTGQMMSDLVFPSKFKRSTSDMLKLDSNDLIDEDFRCMTGVHRALLVGTGRNCYIDDEEKWLHGVDSDVDLVYQCLTDERCGFQKNDVKVLKTNDYPTLRKINKVLDELFDTCEEKDFVFLYFSGHGFHEEDENVDYYLPFDVDLAFNEQDEFIGYKRETCFSFKLLREKIDACKAKFIWVVVDACRVKATAHNYQRSALESLGKLEATRSSLWFQSCESGLKSYERPGLDADDLESWHSCFTWFFCKGAKCESVANDDGYVTPNGLFEYICKQLKSEEPPQIPMRDFKESSLGECRFVDMSGEPRIQVKKAFGEAGKLFWGAKYEQAATKGELVSTRINELLKLEPENQEYLELKKKNDALLVQSYKSQGLINFLNGKFLEAICDADNALLIEPNNTEVLALKERSKRSRNEQSKELPLYYCDRKFNDDTNEQVDKKYRLIKAGSFMMGSPLTGEEVVAKYLKGLDIKDCARFFNDVPLHKVTLTQDFYLARRLVTKGEFSQFIKDTRYKTTAEEEGSAWTLTKEGYWKLVVGKSWRDPGFEQSNDHPVVCISYDDSLAYLAWLNETSRADHELNELKPFYRLPTEAEWEYACHAGTTTEFYWGDEEKDGEGFLNAAGTEENPVGKKWDYHFSFNTGYSATSPVGRFKENPWGLYDMLGNVWEWMSDWYGDYPTGEVTNPEGTSNGSYRVLRGGSWGNGSAFCRCASRGYGRSVRRRADYGFRVAFSLTTK